MPTTFVTKYISSRVPKKQLNCLSYLFCKFNSRIVLQLRLFLAELLLWYLTGNILGVEVSCGRRADDMQMMCRWQADDVWMTREWDFGWDFTGGWHMLSARRPHTCLTCLSCPISCSSTPGVIWMSSAHCPGTHISFECHPHIIHRQVRHPRIVYRHVRHPHVIYRHICHPHIICRIPHGQRGPELSFYCNRNWLLNGICHNNVELFHFRIM